MLSIENPPSSSDPSCSSPTSTHDSPSHLDLPLTHHLPKFSIRDYVFTSRSKDIKKNWPFSLKNLQLCLRHGVKDVLPPFQSLASVKTQSLKPCTVVDESNSLAEKDNIISSSGPNNNSSNTNNIDITSSCRSAAENDLPSATTSVVSHSEIDSLPIPNNPPFEPSLNPTKKFIPQPKKCRLIVKFGGNSDRASAEDIASNSTAVSETMASKVCPVCKTFSSSSNTTLNAHIDQCLSAESPPKWTADSKLTKHRIKQRKSRLMEDIYATAKRCTLEELDKRNGTSWATVSSFSPPSEKLEVPAEVKKQRVVSRLHPEDAGEVGEVYIDASGTKVRILSKSSDATVASMEELPAINDGKEGKIMSVKKKKRHGKKHLKFLKLAPQSRKLFSHKTRAATQVYRPGQGDYGVEDSGKKEKQISCDNSGTLRQWVCSKRTGVAKKVNSNQEGPQPFRCNWHHFARDLLVEKQQSGETMADRNRAQKYANLSENLMSSLEEVERVGKPVYKVQVSDKWERSSGRKRVGSPLLGARLSDTSERSLPLIKHASLTFEPSNTTSNNNKTSTDGGPVTNSETSPRAGTKPSIGRHMGSTKALRTLSRKNGSSISTQSSMIKSRPDNNEQCSVQKNTHCYPSGEGDEEAWHSEVEHHYSMMCDGAENLAGEVADKTSLESSHTTPQSFSIDEQEESDPLTRASDGVVGNVNAVESVEGNVTSSCKSVDTNALKLSNHSRNPSNSLHSIEDYNGMLFGGETLTAHTDTGFVDGETIYSDGGCNVMIQRNPDMGSESPELDPGVGEGNLFPEVDPIPIPGPPGSFLPSPRDMGSDDFQGNSSLTSSRVHSSQDQMDIVDGDLSDSLISATSTISNSTQNRSNLKCSEPLTSVGTHAVQDKMTSSFCTASINVENAVVVPQTGAEAEKAYFDDERFNLSKISIERRPLAFKNDGQPCCCQRKERTNDNAPNYQESQLLKRRTMAAVAAPVMGKQIPTVRLNNLEVRPEVFSLNNCTSVGSEKVVLPFAQPQAGSVLSKGSPETGMKHSARGDSESASPSPSNPVLRLMGKNLMVVNKEDDSPVPVPVGHSQPNSFATSQFPISSGANSTKMKSQDCRSFPQMASQRPMNYGHNPYNGMGQSYDVRISNGFKNYSNPRTPQTPAQISEGLLPNQMISGGFTVSMQPPTYESAYSVPSRYSRTMIRSNDMSSSSAYNVEKDAQKNADGGSSFKEIIVIDDSPENETNVTGDGTKYSEGLRGNYPMTSSGIPFPSVSGYNSRNANPFSRYHTQYPSVSSQSTAVVLHESNSYTIPSRLPNASPVKWSCSPEGSGVLQRSPYVAASNSSGHLRSTLYYSPSLS